MLRPHEMSSVVISGPKNLQEKIIGELYDMEVLHILDHAKSELADIGSPLENAPRLSEVLVKIRSLMATLNIKKENDKFELKKGLTEIESATKRINDEVNKNLEELKHVEKSMSKNNALRQELNLLKDINLPLEYFTNYKSLAFFTGYVNGKDAAPSIKVELVMTTKKYMIFDSRVNNKNFVVLFVDAKIKDHALSILQKRGFSPVNFTNISNLKGTASENLAKIENEAERLHNNKDDIKKRLERLANENKQFLIASDYFLSEQLEKAEAPLKFATTQSSFLIKGWIPTEELHNSINKLNKAGKGNIYIQFEPAKKKDKVPVKLKNTRLAKPFEFFLDLYSMPTYREIDPTFFVFLTFPIFFGIMLGDIGYGLISLVFFWLLKKKMPKARNFFNILMLASFVSILFGFFFGEFFGFEIYHPAVSREHEMFKLMFIAIGIGVIHVNIGLIIGFINEWKSHGFVHAVYAKASWIVLEIGFALLALSYFKKILVPPFVGALFLGASILMLIKAEGIIAPIEIPKIFTNILSYVRLMAIGLSSVILAAIINESATEFFHQGGFFVLIGILILIIGHIINIMLGLLGSFLHSLRLHYVEFFSKFFHGGAEKYKPFGIKDE